MWDTTYFRPTIWIAIFSVAIFFQMSPRAASAQTIREMTQQHVDESIEKEREKKKAAKEKKAVPDPAPSNNSQPGQKSSGAPASQPTPPPKKNAIRKEEDLGETIAKFYHDPTEPTPREKLPKRIIHKWFKLDPMAGVAYRGWLPQDYPSVDTKIANYFTWNVALKGRFFNLVSLKRGYYEANGLSSPRHPYKQNAARYGSYGAKAAFFLLELGIPIMNAWEPVIRYEAKAFQTTAKAKNGKQVCIVDYGKDADEECQPSEIRSQMTVQSAYETAVIGLTYYPSKNPSPVIEDSYGKKPPFFFGLAYLSYVKPYQVTIGDLVLDELLFTGRFYGGGLAFGTKLGGGVNRPKLDIWTQFGLGAAKLTKNMTLNELAPKDWLIGYVQGNLTFSFPWAPFQFAPTILLVPSIEASGATFFFIETQREEGEEFVMPLLNWDLVYCAQLSLIVTL
ncbi:MAG: hypothetical protein JXR76_31110 [Deltaproteobacteria bacterium]|nr:hypothetical protein [Deltaproteobacteria bacterium]